MAVVRSGVTRGSRGDFSRGSYLRCWNMLGVEFESLLKPDLQFRGVWIWEKMSAYPSKPKAWLDSREYFSVGWVKQQLFSNPSLKTECHYCLSMKKMLNHGRGKLFGCYNTNPTHLVSMPIKYIVYLQFSVYIHVFLIHRSTLFNQCLEVTNPIIWSRCRCRAFADLELARWRCRRENFPNWGDVCQLLMYIAM